MSVEDPGEEETEQRKPRNLGGLCLWGQDRWSQSCAPSTWFMLNLCLQPPVEVTYFL